MTEAGNSSNNMSSSASPLLAGAGGADSAHGVSSPVADYSSFSPSMPVSSSVNAAVGFAANRDVGYSSNRAYRVGQLTGLLEDKELIPHMHPLVEAKVAEEVSANPVFQEMRDKMVDDMEIMQVVSRTIQKLFAGNKMMYVPADARQAVIGEVFAIAAQFRNARKVNPNLSIANLERNIGAGSPFFHRSKDFLESYHPALDDEHPDNGKKKKGNGNSRKMLHNARRADNGPVIGGINDMLRSFMGSSSGDSSHLGSDVKALGSKERPSSSILSSSLEHHGHIKEPTIGLHRGAGDTA